MVSPKREDKVPELRLTIKTGFTGADHEKIIEIDDEDWEGWDEVTRERYMQDELDNFITEEIETDWEVVTDD